MPENTIDDLKKIYQSLPNLVFIGVMIFLSMAFNSAFLFLLLGGELGLFLISGTAPVQRLMRVRSAMDHRKEQDHAEGQIVAALPDQYKADFGALDRLCREIEGRSAETKRQSGAESLFQGVIDKLSGFRLEYLLMLRAHFLLANRDYQRIQRDLQEQTKRIQAKLNVEASEAVRQALQQNLTLLGQRQAKVKQLEELVRLIEARLQVVNSSLQLIRDEVDSMTDVRGISTAVDDLLMHLEINDELRTFYDEIKEEGPALAGLDIPGLAASSQASPRPHLESQR